MESLSPAMAWHTPFTTGDDASLAAPPARAERLSDTNVVRTHESQRARARDVVMQNGAVRFVIGGSTRSDGYVPYAGTLLDAEFVGEPASFAYDGIDEFDPQVNGAVIAAEGVEIADDGTRSGQAVVVVRGTEAIVPDVINLLKHEPHAYGLAVELRYTLAAGDTALRIETQVRNPTQDALDVEIGDFAIFGSDEATPFTLPGGLGWSSSVTRPDVVGVVHDTLPWAAAVVPQDGPLALIEGASVRTVLGPDSALWQYVCSHARLAPGDTVTSVRHLALGRTLADAVLGQFERGGAALGRVRGIVRVADQPLPGARLSFFAAGGDFVAQTLSDAAGRYQLQLPAGEYRALPTARGNGEHVAVPGRLRMLAEGHASGTEQHVRVEGGATATMDAELPGAAEVSLSVHDETSFGAPAKVTFERESPAVAKIPELGERELYSGHAIEQVTFVTNGDTQVAVPAGTYTVTASAGPLATLDRRTGVQLQAGSNAALQFELAHKAPRLGYVAIDSHMHGMDSQHGRVTRAERVITSLAEGLDVQVMTDHDRIVDYSELLMALGVSERLTSITSAELSTARLGHHNIWPLRVDPQQPNGGALRWWLGGTLDELYDRAAALGGIVFQVNHGRDYFANAGFDQNSASATESDSFSFRFNAMEICNGPHSQSALVPIWVALLNAGRTVAPLGVSDSHSRLARPGTARTYVWMGDAATTPPDPSAVARAVVALHTVASTGPLVHFSSADGSAHVGDHIESQACGDSGDCGVRLRIEVWAPDWMSIEHVTLVENGAPLMTWSATTAPAVAMPAQDAPALWFEHELEVRPTRSSWYAVTADGAADLTPAYPGTNPWAYSAPIFVDLE